MLRNGPQEEPSVTRAGARDTLRVRRGLMPRTALGCRAGARRLPSRLPLLSGRGWVASPTAGRVGQLRPQSSKFPENAAYIGENVFVREPHDFDSALIYPSVSRRIAFALFGSVVVSTVDLYGESPL